MASPPGKAAQNEVFDASKQAKAPSHLLRNPPLPLPAVRIALVSPAVGYGLFAARDLGPDELIFHERPLLTALFNEKFSADRALVLSQVAAYRAALAAHRTREVTAVAFPALAARFAVAPVGFEEAVQVLEGGMGMNLVGDGGGGEGRQFAGSRVTRKEYEAYTGCLKVSGSVSEADAREAVLDFFKHYAFQVPPNPNGGGSSTGSGGGGGSAMVGAASTREACIYLLGSLINHCCTPAPASSSSTSSSSSPSASCPSSLTGGGKNKDRSGQQQPGPNCSWRIGPSGLAHFVKPRHICVQARRAIREGEQLTWDYGKREKGFVCECDTCRDGLMGGLGSCNVL
ncbi:hypothetical protein C8A01DRAFT_48593 [Parachaetomium inaequale]|uniref:SET domain-containing protein n=1 Tax=Parachaetomium inaequale TaxID=2588326 RepID=A0AAN6PB93_9PEZI|nr:hypothetical protein C8A01DRAFT_48593 [Parachaetomium inaequale]